MVSFAAPVQRAGASGAGLCRASEVTAAQAEELAEACRAAGWDVLTDRGYLQDADDPCDAVLFQGFTFAVLLFTEGAWVTGDLDEGDGPDFAAATGLVLRLLEERFGWVLGLVEEAPD